MAIETQDLDVLAAETGNIYESVTIIAKRARQNASNEKAEIEEKLSYYEGFGPEIEDVRMQEEQARASIEYEKRPKPTERAIGEFLEGDIYFRKPGDGNA